MTSPKTQEKDAAAEPAKENAAVSAEASEESQTRERILQLEEEASRLRDQWLRAVAETENVRKRSQRDQEETARYAVASFARDMAGVVENLKRALGNIPADARGGDGLLKTMAEGLDLTQREILSVFGKYGIKRVDPEGQKFDHNLHQAVVQVERGDVAPGTVVQVVQAGYVLHDRLLMPAMVAVAKAPDAPEKIDETA
ncbi:MAG: nucleotide exchange factor GrpE [Pseudomonadota bacterium]|nr:nucleotide exchange factor GrpE [Pseudomonadota bacterium]MDE3038886.1 nucleotide exchange factor GrpE [Pseudomonadota bacterium]